MKLRKTGRARALGGIVLHGTFFLEPLGPVLRHMLAKAFPNSTLIFSPQNTVMQYLLGPGVNMEEETGKAHVFLFRASDFFTNGMRQFASNPGFNLLLPLKQALDTFQLRTGSVCIVGLCAGHLIDVEQYDLLLEQVTSALTLHANTFERYVIDLSKAASLYGVDDSAVMQEENGLVADNRETYAAYALAIVRALSCHLMPSPKLLIVDCDDTLWGGDCGEDSPHSLSIDSGHIFIQTVLIQKRAEGVRLAIASKNDEMNVRAVFSCRTDLLIKYEDFECSRIQWGVKSSSVRSICEQLRIGYEEVLFIDNDNFECLEVAANCAGTRTLCLPSGLTAREEAVRRCWSLDSRPTTSADKTRAEWYEACLPRSEAFTEAPTIEEFLRRTELQVEVRQMRNDEIGRVCQLTQRTNQFNSTGEDWNAEKMRAILTKAGWTVWVAVVTDCFGPYGIVGAMIVESNIKITKVDSLTLSCRALGRHVEDTMLAVLSRREHDCGRSLLSIRLIETGRNGRFLHLCDRLVAAGLGCKLQDRVEVPLEPFINAVSTEAYGASFAPYSTNGKQQSAAQEYDLEASGTPIETSVFGDAEAILTAAEAVALTSKRLTNSGLLSRRLDDITDTVAEMLRVTLGIENLLQDVDFFDLGGDSLRALELIYDLNDRFGVEIPLTLLFEESLTPGRIIQIVRNAVAISDDQRHSSLTN